LIFPEGLSFFMTCH